MNDDDIYQLVRVGLADLATQARPVDLTAVALRRVRRRRLSAYAGAVGLAGALLVGVPLAIASAGVDPGGRPAAPTISSSLGRTTPAAPPDLRQGSAAVPGLTRMPVSATTSPVPAPSSPSLR